MTSLESMSCLVIHDICSSSVPCMDDGCHGFRDKPLAAKKIFWQLFANAPKYCLKDEV